MMDSIIFSMQSGDVRDVNVTSARQARGDPVTAGQGSGALTAATTGSTTFPQDTSASSAADTGAADAERVANAMRELKNRIHSDTTSLRLRVDGESGSVQAEIVDTSTDRVIRKIPSDEMLRLAAAIKKGSSASIYDGTA